ncbi:hypothetical protein GQX74_000835 [Glossina fuscipes]|nr:hypothetical protein GQX74_000835 [Glossina fuscipes]
MKPATSQKTALPVTYFKFKFSKLVCEKYFWLSLQELQVVQNILKIAPMNNPTLYKNLKRCSLLTHRISLIFTFLYLLLYLWSRNRNSTEFLHEVNARDKALDYLWNTSLFICQSGLVFDYVHTLKKHLLYGGDDVR